MSASWHRWLVHLFLSFFFSFLLLVSQVLFWPHFAQIISLLGDSWLLSRQLPKWRGGREKGPETKVGQRETSSKSTSPSVLWNFWQRKPSQFKRPAMVHRKEKAMWLINFKLVKCVHKFTLQLPLERRKRETSSSLFIILTPSTSSSSSAATNKCSRINPYRHLIAPRCVRAMMKLMIPSWHILHPPSTCSSDSESLRFD